MCELHILVPDYTRFFTTNIRSDMWSVTDIDPNTDGIKTILW